MKKPSRFHNIDYRLFVYLLAGVIILFYVLALTGCLSDSPGIPDIFLVNVHDRGENTTQVRVGYFGMCIQTSSKLQCLSTIGKDTKTIADDFSHDGISIPNNISTLISVSLTIQSKIFPCLVAAAGVLFFVGVVALSLLKRSFKKPNPKKPLRPKLFRTATMLVGGTAIALAIASAVATTQTANALDFATSSPEIGNGTIGVSSGIALQVLQWFVVGFSVLFQLSLASMFKVEGNVNAVGALPFPGSMGRPGPPGGFGGFPSMEPPESPGFPAE
ncbi:Ca2+ regulator and membrane fusion protein Fig1-domain-containing protein [Xylaria sp. FL1777]|nr:Ca2+ regulator and membrane fusion protein Fig1-domain-containing protein [Xylaria sp. FL1777]